MQREDNYRGVTLSYLYDRITSTFYGSLAGSLVTTTIQAASHDGLIKAFRDAVDKRLTATTTTSCPPVRYGAETSSQASAMAERQLEVSRDNSSRGADRVGRQAGINEAGSPSRAPVPRERSLEVPDDDPFRGRKYLR